MSLINKFKVLFEGENPAAKKQKAYKALAKRRGLLSFTETVEAIKEGEDIRGSKFLTEAEIIESKNFVEAAEKNDTIKLTDVILFSPNNLNNHYITQESMEEMVNKFNQNGDENAFNIININHSQTIEDQLGFFSNVTYDEEANVIKGDVEVTRYQNSKLQDMIQVLSESDEIQLGLSIEFTADDWDFQDGMFAYKDTTLVGLALTLTPSAPQTLQDNNKESAQNKIKDSNAAVEKLKNTVENLTQEYDQEKNDLNKKIQELEEQVEIIKKTLAVEQETNKNLIDALKNQTKTVKKLNQKVSSFDTLMKSPSNKSIV